MDVIARTTILRTSIHRDSPTAARAAEWAMRSEQLASEAKALKLTNSDLAIEGAHLATRMSDLALELRSLTEAATRGESAKQSAAHKRAIHTSEQVEVITREPAIRCAGETTKLIATAGHLPSSVILRSIKERLPAALKCYEAGLARDPKLQGRVLVHLIIGLDGKVSTAELATEAAVKAADVVTPGDTAMPALADAPVSACVVDALRGAVFPPPDGGVIRVVYPVVLARSK